MKFTTVLIKIGDFVLVRYSKNGKRYGKVQIISFRLMYILHMLHGCNQHAIECTKYSAYNRLSIEQQKKGIIFPSVATVYRSCMYMYVKHTTKL